MSIKQNPYNVHYTYCREANCARFGDHIEEHDGFCAKSLTSNIKMNAVMEHGNEDIAFKVFTSRPSCYVS